MLVRTRSRLLGCAVALSVVLGASGAQALPLSGDQTEILLTSAPSLMISSVTISALGTGVIAGDNTGLLPGLATRQQALLPVTGGETDTTDIFHDGSGLRFSNGVSDVDLTDLHLNIALSTVTGTLAAGGNTFNDVTLFGVFPCIAQLGSCVDGDLSIIVDGLRLDYSEAVGAALQDMFGVNGATGTQFGVAYPDIRAVPEPSVALLLVSGLAGLAVQGRRRKV